MKKHIRLTAVLSTAAVMTAFAPVLASPVLAQTTGWVQEKDDWRYYDSDGYYVTDTWKKMDSSWYYLDEDGNISLNSQIDEYYVGSDGKRVSNQWVNIPNDDFDDSDENPEFYWYYYGADGKITTSRFKNIEGQTYYFDNEGRMATGLVEINGANYYFGKQGDGVMKKGWVEFINDNEDADEESSWSYFSSSGQRLENQVDKKVGTNYYTFKDGKMVTGWYKLPEEAAALSVPDDAVESASLENAETGADTADNSQAQDVSGADAADSSQAQDVSGADAADSSQAQDVSETAALAEQKSVSKNTAAGYQYYNENGTRASGWMTITGIPGLSDEDELYKFYFKSGQPYFAENDAEIFRVGTSRYCFNEKGEMQTGLQLITLEDGSSAHYYFGTDGAMKTGKQTIYDEESGITQTWFFHTDSEKLGQSFHGIRDNVIYNNGLRQQADSYSRYAAVSFEGNQYLVNASGTIQKASSASKSSERPALGAGYRDLKDAFDNIWTIDVNGMIQQ